MTTTGQASETERMRRIPGIYFMDNAPLGRVPAIDGTGLGVWEIIQGYVSVDRDWQALLDAFDWLTPAQLGAALAYYEAFPDEIDGPIQENARLYEEYLQNERMPSLSSQENAADSPRSTRERPQGSRDRQ